MRIPMCGLLVAFTGSLLLAQTFPPGFVDPAPMLAAASLEIGERSLRCIAFSGTGYGGAVGQAFESAPNIDWPRIDALANYTRTIDFEARTIKEEFDRKPGLNPASWKYGLGWQDGTPLQKNVHQTFVVSGNAGWHLDGVGAPPVAMSSEDVERGQLEIWMNPHGFLKAARLPGANPRAYAIYVDERDKVWLTDTAADTVVMFDPVTEAFTTIPISKPSNVAQLGGRPGEVWGAQRGRDHVFRIRFD